MNQITFISRTVSLLLFLTQDIASKTAESDYQKITVDCRNLMGDINQQLGKLMSQLPSSR
jgi:hypothetical protein